MVPVAIRRFFRRSPVLPRRSAGIAFQWEWNAIPAPMGTVTASSQWEDV